MQQLNHQANAKGAQSHVKRGCFGPRQRATILCGVTICENAAVDASSVVMPDVPAGAVWGGNPERRLEQSG